MNTILVIVGVIATALTLTGVFVILAALALRHGGKVLDGEGENDE